MKYPSTFKSAMMRKLANRVEENTLSTITDLSETIRKFFHRSKIVYIVIKHSKKRETNLINSSTSASIGKNLKLKGTHEPLVRIVSLQPQFVLLQRGQLQTLCRSHVNNQNSRKLLVNQKL